MSESDAKRASKRGWRPSNFYVRLTLFSTALVIVTTGISFLIVLQLNTPSSLERSLGDEGGPLVLGAGISIGIASLLALLFSRRIVEPIDELVKATDRLARGDLKYRVSVERSDELGMLARSFNSMADELSESQKELEREHVQLLMTHERAERANMELAAEVMIRKRAEEENREKAELLDKAHDAILVRDLENRIVFWNKSAEKLYGWTRDDVLGRDMDITLHRPEDIESLREVLGFVMAQGEWSGELRQISKTGEMITVESRWSLVRDSEGLRKSILVINTNVTEQKRLEEQLLRAQRMESIGTLAGGIAHDLNNALTPILVSASFLKTRSSDEATLEIVNNIENAANRAAKMVKQVLTFARGVEGERVPLNPKQLIAEIQKIAEETFLKQITIETDIASDLHAVIGDATQIHQVLLNLCVNARDAMPNGGKLTLAARNITIDENYSRLHVDAKPGQYVLTSVSDTGTGIPPEIREKIFEPFFTTKAQGQGTGLGLSTVIAIVKSHGGFLNLYSEVGKGTRFDVYLPAHEDVEVTTPQQEDQFPNGHGELVLLVDDEAPLREIIGNILQTFGYRVITACDGNEALMKYAQQQNEIAVVFTDMMMPFMDGPAMIRSLRRFNPKARIIAATGLATQNKIIEAKLLGVDAFVSKPYSAEKILKVLQEVLARPESELPAAV
jgi:two-component system cell cycle sensor histidine kinase/response regulator CckA